MEKLKKYLLFSLIISFIFGGFIISKRCFAQDDYNGCEGKTVFVDVSTFGRKSHAAKRMTKMHQEFALEGWTVVDVTLYTENSDLEGFFVTYVRK